MEIILKNRSFSKRSFFKTIVFVNARTIVFKKLVVSLTIVIDDPSLTIVNEDRRREETDMKGIGSYH